MSYKNPVSGIPIPFLVDKNPVSRIQIPSLVYLRIANFRIANGAGELLVTSMDRDGTQVGFDVDLTSKISSKVNIPVIASGGAGNLDHLVDGIKLGNASAVLAASIFHYGKYSVKEASLTEYFP